MHFGSTWLDSIARTSEKVASRNRLSFPKNNGLYQQKRETGEMRYRSRETQHWKIQFLSISQTQSFSGTTFTCTTLFTGARKSRSYWRQWVLKEALRQQDQGDWRHKPKEPGEHVETAERSVARSTWPYILRQHTTRLPKLPRAPGGEHDEAKYQTQGQNRKKCSTWGGQRQLTLMLFVLLHSQNVLNIRTWRDLDRDFSQVS